jgi:lipopolysaccharide export system protein LptA
MKPSRIFSGVLIGALAAASALLGLGSADAQTRTNAFGGLSESSDKPIDIQSEALTIYTDQYALFSGNVKAEQGGTTLRSRELKVHFVGNADGKGRGAEPAKQPADGASTTSPAQGEGESASAPAAAPAAQPAPRTEQAATPAAQPPTSTAKPVTPTEQSAAKATSEGQKAKSKDNAQGTIDEPMDIQSDLLLVHDKEKYAHFKGNVRVVQGDTRLSSAELKVNYSGGDSLAATSQPDTGSPTQITKIEAFGDVRAHLAPKGAKGSQPAKTSAKTPASPKPEAAPAPALTASGGETGAGARATVARDAPRTAPAASGDGARVSAPSRVATAEKTEPTTEVADAAPPTKKSKQISELEATGGVVITSENDETATSDWAVYNLASDLVTIGGNVVLTQKDTVLKGDRLVIDLKSGESRFENTGTTADGGGRRIRALFMPKDEGGKPEKRKNKNKTGGPGDNAAGFPQMPPASGAAVDDTEPLPIVPEYR